MPVEILVHFDNGQEVLETWDGRDRTYNLIYNKPAKVVWAKVDPYNKISMDVNKINNSYTTEPEMCREQIFCKVSFLGRKHYARYGFSFLTKTAIKT